METGTSPSTTALNWNRWVLTAIVLLVVGVGVQYAIKASHGRSAFVRWRNQVLALGQGEDIYRRYIYPNPPIMALILYPLAQLPPVNIASFNLDTGALAWFVIKAGLTVVAFWWAFRLVQDDGFPFPPWAQMLAVLLSLRPIVGDLSHGNVNLLILFLVVAGLYAFHRRHDATAGVLLALAMACKVTPALFIPYFLWKRAWRTLAGCALGLILFLLVIPGALLGPRHNLQLFRSWLDVMVLPYARDGKVWTEHNNQSLPGLVYRLGTHSPSFLDAYDQPLRYDNLLQLNPSTARRIVQVCGVMFLMGLFWVCRTPLQPRNNWLLAAEFSMVVLGMLLFSERTWKHHCVTLALPFTVLSYALARLWPSAYWRYALIGCLTGAVVLMASTSTSLWEHLFGLRQAAKMAQVYGAYVWAYFLLLVPLTAILAIRPRQVAHNPSSAAFDVSLPGLFRSSASHPRRLQRSL